MNLKRKVIDSFTGKYAWLHNDSPARITLMPLDTANVAAGELDSAPTASHAYEIVRCAFGVDSAQIATRLKETKAGPELRSLAGKLPSREGWGERTSIEIMAAVLLAKFSKEMNPELHRRLINTGDAVLVFRNQNGDQFWGVSGPTGKNILGQILMHVRAKVVKVAPPPPVELA